VKKHYPQVQVIGGNIATAAAALALVKAGAFDRLHPYRERVFESVGLAFQHAEQLEANAAQGGLFDFADAPASEPDLLECKPWGVRERLTLEKAAIGFYLSGHLFDEHAAEVLDTQESDRP
jgi:DNA polymerase-3 subunit alpha